ncbi:hypothetical protein ACFFX1_10925 [Dactylosporangium sucinum]|uniref:Uncharacterized protein n=1 Tax=Dactylosporangium sucinum TaxID=1424081 RepID=A0A917TGY0_9ACTN|nr:hypothetical protein [Dactylosporangium sucinum]GGM22767.1 hypothetical protein GCM10007977_024950 [Dactylosporangium sucinum]
MPDDESRPAGTCCGEKYCGAKNPAQAGKPLAPTCILCPRSPTYWRKAGAGQTQDSSG